MDRRPRTSGVNATGLGRRHKPDYRLPLYMGLLMLLGLIVMFAIGPSACSSYERSVWHRFYWYVLFGKQAGAF